MKYDHTEISSAGQALSSTITELSPLVETLKDAIETVTDEIGYGLQGQAYDAFKQNLLDNVVPVVEAFENVLGDIELAYDGYTSEEQLVNNQASRIDTEKLETSVEKLEKLIKSAQQMKTVYPTERAEFEATITVYQQQIDTINDKIDAVKNFSTKTATTFDTVGAALKLIKEAMRAIADSKITNTGQISFSGKTEWLSGLKTYNQKSESGTSLTGPIPRPKNMSDKDYKAYKAQIQKDAKQLYEEGWSKTAIRKGYVAYVTANVAAAGTSLAIPFAQNAMKQAHIVGSELFSKMVDVAFTDTSAGARASVDMVYRVLGAKMDNNHFMQLTNVSNPKKTAAYSFPSVTAGEVYGADMPNYLKFATRFSELIQKSYSGLLTDDFDNQMRYWLDKPVVDMVNQLGWDREKFEFWVDANKLPHTAWGTSDAQAHNRIDKQTKSEGKEAQLKALQKQGKNEKDQVAGYHVEIVFDSNGHPVSMWNDDVLKYNDDGTVKSSPDEYTSEQLQVISNTDSANYASNSSDKVDGVSVHDLLDFNPAYDGKHNESDLRTASKAKFKQADSRDDGTGAWDEFSKKQ
jgi:hypothetical protein